MGNALIYDLFLQLYPRSCWNYETREVHLPSSYDLYFDFLRQTFSLKSYNCELYNVNDLSNLLIFNLKFEFKFLFSFKA